MPAAPAISVVMATLDSAAYLAQALDSIADQSLAPAEVIVVDGGSRDGTVEIAAARPGVTVLRQAGQGLASAWNEGIALAGGNLVAWLDSDDRWRPGALAAHATALDQHPGADASAGRVRFFSDNGTVPRGFRPELLEGDHLAFMPGCSVVRRSAIDRIGPFREDLGVATDIDWFAHLREAVEVVTLPLVVLDKRVHDRNLSYGSSGSRDYAHGVIAAAAAQLRRRRAQP